jgi:RNA polymerase sigma-70 factor, ECF subfamily
MQRKTATGFVGITHAFQPQGKRGTVKPTVSAARVISQHQGDSLSITSEAVQFISDESFVAAAKGHATDFCELHTHQAEGIAENRYPIGGRPGHYRPRKLRRTELHQQELKTFEEILLTSRAKFVAMADTILRDKEDAEDAVQNAFLSAYVHFRSFEGRSALKTWLTRIVLNAALMVLRRRKRTYVVPLVNPNTVDEIAGVPQIADAQPDPEKIYADEETFRRIDAELERMSPTLRQAFAMTYYGEMSSREACAVLGIPICRLNARVFRARKLIVTRVSPSSAAFRLKKAT